MKSGIDPNLLDTATRPQDDLYKYANGAWLATHQIPEDRSNSGVSYELFLQAEAQVRAIIEADQGKIGRLYNCFMNTDKIEADGSRGVKTFVVRIGERRARACTTLLITAGYLGVAIFAIPGIGIFPWFVAPLAGLAAIVALPALKIVAAPRPAAPPAGYPLWPLWHVGAAFLASRPAMGALLVGLIVGAILGR